MWTIAADASDGGRGRKGRAAWLIPIPSAMSGLAAGAREAWARRDRITWTLVGLVVLIAVGLWAFLQVWTALSAFVIGGFLAFLLRPVVALFVNGGSWSRGLAVLVTALLLVALFVVAMAFLIPRLSVQFQQFSENLPTYKAQFQVVGGSAHHEVQRSAQVRPECRPDDIETGGADLLRGESTRSPSSFSPAWAAPSASASTCSWASSS